MSFVPPMRVFVGGALIGSLLPVSAAVAAEERMTTDADKLLQTDSQQPQQQAQDAADPSHTTGRTMKDLLGEGFEIRTVTLVPHDVVLRAGGTNDVDAVMILLQKGADVANCYVTFGSFADGSYYNGVTPVCSVLK